MSNPSEYPYLAKSRLISAWQCPKRLHLEQHHPELGEVSANTESLFATGHRVGEISQELYGTADSIEIPFNRSSTPCTSGSATPLPCRHRHRTRDGDSLRLVQRV